MGSTENSPKAHLFTLYGMEASLFTARPRSYMRMHGIPFKEVKAGGREYTKEVMPKIGRWIIPVLKTPEGDLIQDGADIIDFFDSRGFSKFPVYPADRVLRTIAHVFELFGSHGLMRPAMHYRWNFDEVNLRFIRDAFRDILPDGLSPEKREEFFLRPSGMMRKATVLVGVTDETISTIEQSYAQFLLLLNKHLEDYPFVLGGYATLADYGLIGAMYAHLGRDPVPLRLMQTEAPRVFRWVERMNMPETFEDESVSASAGELFDPNELPKSLLDLLKFVSYDYLPEISAHVGYASEWIASNTEVTEGTSTKDEILKRGMGLAAFSWHGQEVQSLVLPYRLFLLERLQNSEQSASESEQRAIRHLLEKVGLKQMLELKTARPVHRLDNHEVFGALR